MQQINLYLPEFRPNREPLRAVHMLWGILGLIILLGLFSGYSSYQTRQLEQELLQEKLALETLQLELQKLALQPSSRQIHQLDSDIERLQLERSRREQILTVISRQDLGNSNGFSSQMEAMARQSLSTLALESFSLQEGGSYVEFAGVTRQPDQVPLYLQRLRGEPSFAAVRFGVLNVERKAANAVALNFQVAKSITEKEGKK